MRFVPLLLILIGLVVLLAGPNRRGLQVAERLLVTVIAAVVLALLFGLVLRRTL